MFALLLCFCAVAHSVPAETDFWFEETGRREGRRPDVTVPSSSAARSDVFDSITKEDTERVNTPAEQVAPLENHKPGPMAHVMLQAFDEDGDGLLDSKELAKINKNVNDVTLSLRGLMFVSSRPGLTFIKE